jgi:hypothetical protein
MQAALQALDEALARVEPRKRRPPDGRQVVAEFLVRRGDRTRKATFARTVPYVSGNGDGFGGCELALELDDQSGYVRVHQGEGPAQVFAEAAAQNEGWSYEPGSLVLTVALGFTGPRKAALTGALAAVAAEQFR